MAQGTGYSNGQEAFAAVDQGMKGWREQHPKATLQELETALDQRLAAVRAQVLAELAQASKATSFQGRPAAERPTCPACRIPLQARGRHRRKLRLQGNVPVEVSRE